jgi:hypothetical protein
MQFVRYVAAVLLTVVVVLGVVDAIVQSSFPDLPRFADNFSAAYLSRTVTPARLSGRVAIVGDSVLWGYGIPASATAAAILRGRGVRIINLAFEGGSMVNTYALIRLIAARRVEPRIVVFNVNIKEFNAADSAYQTLHPALERLAWVQLSAEERGLLRQTQPMTNDAAIDRALSLHWQLYGMRTDLREILFGQADAASALAWGVGEVSGRNARSAAGHLPTAERFLGTYDLSPLTEKNVEVIFLRKTVGLLKSLRIRSIAVITPTNHLLLHDYIDVPDYDDQLSYVERIIGPYVRVLNYDRAFAAAEFIDNDHLTAAGNRHLAQLLLPLLRQ